jgi:hypothetical protein
MATLPIRDINGNVAVSEDDGLKWESHLPEHFPFSFAIAARCFGIQMEWFDNDFPRTRFNNAGVPTPYAYAERSGNGIDAASPLASRSRADTSGLTRFLSSHP